LSGYLSKQQAEKALGEADRLLIPSRIESIPVVFSDAMAFCIPVVAMPVGDLPDLIGKNLGWVSAETTSTSFLSAVRAAIRTGSNHPKFAESITIFSLTSACQRILTASNFSP
jgi:glycosyltransferase involved in cell wall biosynthesis